MKDKPAFPHVPGLNVQPGLTVRQVFTAVALHSLATMQVTHGSTPRQIGRMAAALADATIAELEAARTA